MRVDGHNQHYQCENQGQISSALLWTIGVSIAGVTPNLASVNNNVEGAVGFGQFDFFKGSHVLRAAQELFSFVTEDRYFTPTRVPRGACDSAFYFQLQMHSCFQDMLYTAVLVWIDDILLFAKTRIDYFVKLEQFFVVLRERGLKFNALKCRLFARSVRWCGKIVTGQEVKHDPSRLEALVNMELPPTAVALQQFLCATNWVRDTVVDFARVFAPLQDKLETEMAKRGRRRQQLTGERRAFKDATTALAHSSPLQYPSEAVIVNFFVTLARRGGLWCSHRCSIGIRIWGQSSKLTNYWCVREALSPTAS
ncbi:hypothetical protein PHMEG_00022882 [Phytophthora megakarya]|uniref:Reverse transcriptase domain-containing protein n=1 Tax=Phytophthora megakarya TaxID=4795 RepID=A0A225VIC6_9STRA|nr:hypothetical protein PHMEG_00022882 [Phytophthora megakarya]